MNSKGFTLVELLVTVTIFIVMTALLVARYGSFNDGAILSSTSYDIALALRDAQSYGVNVQGKTVSGSQSFNYPYGIHFNTIPNTNNQFVLFADSNPLAAPDGVYTAAADTLITSYMMQNGSFVSSLCAGSGPGTPCKSTTLLDISFKRPDPNAIIESEGNKSIQYAYAEIQIKSGTGTGSRTIVVRETGEIAVQNQ